MPGAVFGPGAACGTGARACCGGESPGRCRQARSRGQVEVPACVSRCRAADWYKGCWSAGARRALVHRVLAAGCAPRTGAWVRAEPPRGGLVQEVLAEGLRAALWYTGFWRRLPRGRRMGAADQPCRRPGGVRRAGHRAPPGAGARVGGAFPHRADGQQEIPRAEHRMLRGGEDSDAQQPETRGWTPARAAEAAASGVGWRATSRSSPQDGGRGMGNKVAARTWPLVPCWRGPQPPIRRAYVAPAAHPRRATSSSLPRLASPRAREPNSSASSPRPRSARSTARGRRAGAGPTARRISSTVRRSSCMAALTWR